MLALLVGVSLILLTAYFGESPSSPLHSVQRGIVEVLSPIQQGASKVLSPVRDVAGWFSDTFHAKSRADQLQQQGQQAHRAARAAPRPRSSQNTPAEQAGRARQRASGSTPTSRSAAHVISRDPTLWYETIEVDKGSDDGVHVNDPVIGDGGAGRQGLRRSTRPSRSSR